MSIVLDKTKRGYFLLICNNEGGTVAWGEGLTWKQVNKLIKKWRGKLL